MVPYQNPQPALSNGYSNYAASNGGQHSNQTYPGLPRKPVNGYSNGLQIPNQPYHPSSLHHTGDQYGIIPVSAVQQEQAMYTDSPVDTTAFPSYYTQEPQDLTNEMSAMGYDTTNGMPYQQQGTYSAMQYLNTQHNYKYQG
jgi:hypothetical protein